MRVEVAVISSAGAPFAAEGRQALPIGMHNAYVLDALHLIRAADITLEVALRRNDVHGGAEFLLQRHSSLLRGGIIYVMYEHTVPYRDGCYYLGGAVETEKCT